MEMKLATKRPVFFCVISQVVKVDGYVRTGRHHRILRNAQRSDVGVMKSGVHDRVGFKAYARRRCYPDERGRARVIRKYEAAWADEGLALTALASKRHVQQHLFSDI